MNNDLTRTTLATLAILCLIAATGLILAPFFSAAIWAAMIVTATWPLNLRLRRKLSRPWAAALMTALLLLVVFVPLGAALAALARHGGELAGLGQLVSRLPAAGAPDWLTNLPIVGPQFGAIQGELSSPREMAERLLPFARGAAAWLLGKAGSAGMMLVQFLLAVAMSAVLYVNGEAAADFLQRLARRLAAERGSDAVGLAGRAVRGVALGVVVTAIAQGVMAGVGLAVCGVPGALLLGAATFVLCAAQVGPLPVLLPAAGWLYWQGHAGWAVALAVWAGLVAASDTLLRPALIQKEVKLPMTLIFAGVLGGLLTIGVVGLFVGPTLLAVAYTLLAEWVGGPLPPVPDQQPAEGGGELAG